MSRFPAEANPQFTLVTHPVRWIIRVFRWTIRVFGRYILLALGFSVLWGLGSCLAAFCIGPWAFIPAGENSSCRVESKEPAEAAYFTLGRELLMQNEVRGAVAQHHIRFIAHADGRWNVSNASARRGSCCWNTAMASTCGPRGRWRHRVGAVLSVSSLNAPVHVTEIVIVTPTTE